jgi:hypothetical protein
MYYRALGEFVAEITKDLHRRLMVKVQVCFKRHPAEYGTRRIVAD